jgi:hypothetical protein
MRRQGENADTSHAISIETRAGFSLPLDGRARYIQTRILSLAFLLGNDIGPGRFSPWHPGLELFAYSVA